MAKAAALSEGARRERDMERLAGYTMLDDAFMRAVMKDNRELAQMALRIVTDIGDLEVVDEETQRDLKRVGGSRSTVLDVFCVDGEGSQYDMEVQRGEGL
ncbi:MAG: hypothetical protein Q4D39_08240, partial [Coriobacteriaceae bacterium]|nr:hypothetical protein [Coriobacteriaceae bacterium]